VDTLKFVKLAYYYPNVLSFIDRACARNMGRKKFFKIKVD